MAPRLSVYDHFEEINGFYKCKRCGSRLKKPADGSTGTLRKHAKIFRISDRIRFFGSDRIQRTGSGSGSDRIGSNLDPIRHFCSDTQLLLFQKFNINSIDQKWMRTMTGLPGHLPNDRKYYACFKKLHVDDRRYNVERARLNDNVLLNCGQSCALGHTCFVPKRNRQLACS